MTKYDRAVPKMYFIAALTNGDRFSKTMKEAVQYFLEGYFTLFSLRENPDLLNEKDTKIYRALRLSGFFNSKNGGPSAATQGLKAMLGVGSKGI